MISIASIVEEKDSQVIVGLGLFIRKQDRETGIGIGKGPRNWRYVYLTGHSKKVESCDALFLAIDRSSSFIVLMFILHVLGI